jgi:major membrane immunogen (membrane-anchored lipoprotein)
MRYQMGSKKKGLIGLAIMLVFSVIMIWGTESIEQMIDEWETKQEEAQNVPTTQYKDGTYVATAKEFAGNGYKEQVTLTVQGGVITALDYESIHENGNKKSQLSMNGEYVMTENGLLWHEQAELLAQYVIENQAVEGLTLDEDGKTDVIAGVSISIDGFVDLVKEALAQAMSGPVVSQYKDGTYVAAAKEYAGNGYKEQVTLTIQGGVITGLDYESIHQDGRRKSELSMNGEYVMTEDGLLWYEQAELLAQYVIENQAVEGLTLDEDGKTDVIAGVSISIDGFVDLVKEALAQAMSGAVVSQYKDGTYVAEPAEYASNGYKDRLTLTIQGGVITALDYESIHQDGGKKSELSMNGEYVMTEDGLLWYEQAELLAQYVIENQGTEGLTLDEDGKTDVIAGVSIRINGFVELVKEALAQATNVPVASQYKDGTYVAEPAEYASNGYKDQLTLTIQGGVITALDYESIHQDGGKKSELSMNGEYVMTEDGLLWYEQAELLAQYVIENQGTEGLTLDEDGKTDVIAGVSIRINGFVELVKEALAQATNVPVASQYKDGTYVAEPAEYASNGYKDRLTLTIQGGVITALDYESIHQDGGKKSELSMNGEYVMTEDGLLWYEQAELLAQYVIENQGTEGLVLNEDGKTDVIAGVSIRINGFVELVKEALIQAV